MIDQVTDRREATTEKITLLTSEIGAIEAELTLLWPWQRKKARALTEQLGKKRGDLHAELGNRAASMAAKAVVRPLEAMGIKQDEMALTLARLDARVCDIHERQSDTLTGLQTWVIALEKRAGE